MRYVVIRLLLTCLAWVGVSATDPATARDGPRVHAGVRSPEGGHRNVYILSFGLFGEQRVFERKARGAAGILAATLGGRGHTIVRFNTRSGGGATPRALFGAMRATVRGMKSDTDVLVLVLTSHGSPHGLAVVAGRRETLLTPELLGDMLNASGARYRVVIISACFSGTFVPALADPRTLVITASAADRSSFGCEDRAKWTYFGDAFFNQALRRTDKLDVAFEEAKRIVTAREQQEGFPPSNPQIAGGAQVLDLLDR